MATFGEEMRSLMAERDLSLRRLAGAVHYDLGYLSKVSRDLRIPSLELAEKLDSALDGGGILLRAVDEALTQRQGDIRRVTAWVSSTNTTDEAVEQITRATIYLAEVHGRVPAQNVLSQILSLNKQAQEILRSGKQRLRQTRELLRVSSELYAHSSILLGDIGEDRNAAEHGAASLLFAQEAEADESHAWTAQAKTARWQGRHVESAGLARRGFETSALGPTKVELAYREANAIALFGDAVRAREALHRAENTANALRDRHAGDSVWSFPVERQAVFSLSVAVYTRDADAALHVVDLADERWKTSEPSVPATWAQIRAGAGMAYVIKGELDGAAIEMARLMELPSELRIGTVTGYLKHLDRLLSGPEVSRSREARDIRHQIRDFSSASTIHGMSE